MSFVAKGLFLQYLWSPLPTSLFTSHLPTNVNSKFSAVLVFHNCFHFLLPSLCPVGICPPSLLPPPVYSSLIPSLGVPTTIPLPHHKSLSSPRGSFPARISHLQGPTSLTFTSPSSPPPRVTFAKHFLHLPALFSSQGSSPPMILGL